MLLSCSVLRTTAALSCGAWVLALAACGAGGGGSGDTSGVPGQELAKPGGVGTFFVDPSRGGSASRLHLAEMYWARLVDVHDIDDQGRANSAPVYRNFAINENVQSDPSSFTILL